MVTDLVMEGALERERETGVWKFGQVVTLTVLSRIVSSVKAVVRDNLLPLIFCL